MEDSIDIVIIGYHPVKFVKLSTYTRKVYAFIVALTSMPLRRVYNGETSSSLTGRRIIFKALDLFPLHGHHARRRAFSLSPRALELNQL